MDVVVHNESVRASRLPQRDIVKSCGWRIRHPQLLTISHGVRPNSEAHKRHIDACQAWSDTHDSPPFQNLYHLPGIHAPEYPHQFTGGRSIAADAGRNRRLG